jgi:hypothetical protein
VSELAIKTSIPWHSAPLRRALEVIESTVAGMGDEEMTWAPEGKWSPALILEHLSLAFHVTTKASRRMLRLPKPDVRPATPKERFWTFLFLKGNYFHSGTVAPKMVCPKGMSPQEAKEAIRMKLIEMDKTLQECEEKFGGSVDFLVHASLGPLTVREWCKFSYLHTRHHMKQIRGLRQRMTHVAGANRDGSSRPAAA